MHLDMTEITKNVPSKDEIMLEWQNLNVEVEVNKKYFWNWFRKREKGLKIINNVSGSTKSGNLVAIMGDSGSGKTTLLAAISQRLRGNISGHIKVNGLNISREYMTKLSGFVAQYDVTIDSLTVKEHLNFMCKMKVYHNKEKLSEIEKLLEDLGMRDSSNTKISSLSGGERKKLNLACELLTQPPILFCDEPTTGLDSYSALSVIQTLQKLTKCDRKAILCSIHHPTSDIFECFSHIILVNSGRIIYQGSTSDAKRFFEKIGLPCPQSYNPADFYVRMSSNNIFDTESQVETILRHYEKSIVPQTAAVQYDEDIVYRYSLIRENANWWQQLLLLMTRSIIAYMRSTREYIVTTGLFMITTITITSLYLNIRPTSQTAIQDIRGAIFIISSEVIFTTSYSVLYIFPSELPLLRREVGEKLYNLSAYYVHRTLFTIPKCIFETFLFIGIIYFFVEFSGDFVTYVQMASVCTMASILAMAHAYLLSSIFESTNLSLEVANVVFLLFMLLGGLYLNIRSFKYMKYLSCFFYANEGMSIYYWTAIEHIECDDIIEYPCLNNGYEILNMLGYATTEDVIFMNYGLMLISTIIVHIIAYFNVKKFIKKIGFY